MRQITDSIIFACATTLLLAASGCNNKSPETAGEPAEVDTSEVAEREAPEPKEPPRPDPLPMLEGDHRPAFDLAVNRPLAHVVSGDAMVFDAGKPDFVRYVHGDHPGHWELGVEIEGRMATRLDRRRDSTIWLPALEQGPATIELEVFNPANRTNKLSLEVNGEPAGERELKEGWQTVRYDIADAALENAVEVEFSGLGRIGGDLSGGAFGIIRLGKLPEKLTDGSPSDEGTADDPAADGADEDSEASEASALEGDAGVAVEQAAAEMVDLAEDEATRAAARRGRTWLPDGQGAFEIEGDEGLAWYVAGLDDAKIEVVLRGAVGCGVKIVVDREDAAGGSKTEVESELLLVDTHGDEQTTFVSFPVPKSDVGRVTMRRAGDCDTIEVAAARMVFPGARPEPVEAPKPKRIIVWMIDTLRSDYLPIHFETDVQAPNLKQLADEGASFKWAYVQGNESRTSHASFFAGMYPSKHRVLGRGHLKPWHELLPEALQKAGYETGAYISNGYVSKPWGFVQGWDTYRNNLREGYGIHAEAMAEDGIEWARKHKDDPFFLYLGTIDPHVTYRRHKDLIDIYDPEPYNGRFQRYCLGTDLGKIKGGGIRVDDRDKARILALYKNEITFNDRAFGKLRKQLEEEGMWEDTMVIVTSDHGEEFWEHGSVGHGHNMYGELVHVPMIVYYPGAIPAGTVVESGADVLDIFPTVLDLVGAEPVEDVQGKSLMGLIQKVDGDYPEPAIATQYLMHYAMQLGRWKLYLRKGSFEVFDRENDLLEQTDVADEHPFATRQLLDAMGWFRPYRDRWDKDSWGVPSNLSDRFLSLVAADEDPEE